MVSWDYQILDYRGLHVKPIAKIMSALAGIRCSAWLSCHGRRVRAGDVMGLMELEARKGDILTFQFMGEDEEAASGICQELLTEIRL